MQICYVRHNVVDPESCGRAGTPLHRKDSVYFNYIFLISPFPSQPWPRICFTLNFRLMIKILSGFMIIVNCNVFHGNFITVVDKRKLMLPSCRNCGILDIVASFPRSLKNLSSCLQQESQSWKLQDTDTSSHHMPDFQLKPLSIFTLLSILDNYWTYVVQVLHVLNWFYHNCNWDVDQWSSNGMT